jgi:hypothetical protein
VDEIAAKEMCGKIILISHVMNYLLTFDKQSNIRRATRLASRKLRREFCDAACV